MVSPNRLDVNVRPPDRETSDNYYSQETVLLPVVKMDLSLTESPARNCCHLPRDRSGAADETFRGVSFRRRPTGSHDLIKFITLIERPNY